MKIVLQRVKKASVEIGGKVHCRIDQGVCLFVGVEKGDSLDEATRLAQKIVDLRIFPDAQGKMNLSLLEKRGKVLAVSQFTLAGSTAKGRRPSFDRAEEPQLAEKIFDSFVQKIKDSGLEVEKGVFGALMEVCLINDGPVTFILASV
ncbi:MAG: D-aminoacyl-tRNA deacylase [Candidatus Aminicenantes bacterium]|nr:D-aminoacyl-tRNA deacylase [Candidatus Aminicenantes bacterium]